MSADPEVRRLEACLGLRTALVFGATQIWRGATTALLLGAVFLLPATKAQGAVLRVPEDFGTIQAAVDAALAGDSVLLAAGTYSGEGNSGITVERSLTICSLAGPESTVLADADPQWGIFFSPETSDDELAVSGLSIVGAAGGIYATEGGSLHVKRARLLNCSSPGGINANWGSVTLESVVFESNHSSTHGGGVDCSDCSVEILSCDFAQNRSSWGGAVSLFNSDCVIEEGSFEGNQAFRTGGAIRTAGTGSLVVRGSLFAGNQAETISGGAIDWSQVDGSLEQCQFIDNQAFAGGGAVIVDAGGTSLVTGCLFFGNSANNAAAVLAVNGSACTIIGCTIVENTVGASNSSALGIGFQAMVSTQSCIIAWNLGGSGVSVAPQGQADVLCCNVFGNELGEYSGEIVDPTGSDGNISLDPMFCGPVGSGEFHLSGNSPCTASSSDCGQIGAFGIGCGETSIGDTHWGSIKRLY